MYSTYFPIFVTSLGSILQSNIGFSPGRRHIKSLYWYPVDTNTTCLGSASSPEGTESWIPLHRSVLLPGLSTLGSLPGLKPMTKIQINSFLSCRLRSCPDIYIAGQPSNKNVIQKIVYMNHHTANHPTNFLSFYCSLQGSK